MPARKRVNGHEITRELTEAVAALIKENRSLKRQVVKLTERAGNVKAIAGLRTIQRRAERALSTPVRRRRRRTAKV